jgi:toxin ParE1/3/4
MAEVVWTAPAVSDLDAIADYIALDNPDAAKALVARVFEHVEQLQRFPSSGWRPPELRGGRYRQIVEPPCRFFYRVEGRRVFILHVMRSEQRFRRKRVR